MDPATRESWTIHEEDFCGSFSTFASLSKFLENRVVSLTLAPVLLEEASDQAKTSQKGNAHASEKIDAHLFDQKNVAKIVSRRNTALQHALILIRVG